MISLSSFIISLCTAIVTGIVVSYINNILQMRKDELSVIRAKTETIVIMLNKLSLDYHLMLRQFESAVANHEIKTLRDQLYGSPNHLTMIEKMETIQSLVMIYFPRCTVQIADFNRTTDIITAYIRNDVANHFSSSFLQIRRPCNQNILDQLGKFRNDMEKACGDLRSGLLQEVNERAKLWSGVGMMAHAAKFYSFCRLRQNSYKTLQ